MSSAFQKKAKCVTRGFVTASECYSCENKLDSRVRGKSTYCAETNASISHSDDAARA